MLCYFVLSAFITIRYHMRPLFCKRRRDPLLLKIDLRIGCCSFGKILARLQGNVARYIEWLRSGLPLKKLWHDARTT